MFGNLLRVFDSCRVGFFFFPKRTLSFGIAQTAAVVVPDAFPLSKLLCAPFHALYRLVPSHVPNTVMRSSLFFL